MPPGKQFSREQIIQTAFEIAKSGGLDGITARKVAGKLGSSVAPIYVNFKDIEELKKSVAGEIFRLSQGLIKDCRGDNKFLTLGIAGLRFAREYKMLFRDMVLKENEYLQEYQKSATPQVLDEMTADPLLECFNEGELMDIFLKMQIFQMGLSVMIAYRKFPDEFSEEAQTELLEAVGKDIIEAARRRKENQQ